MDIRYSLILNEATRYSDQAPQFFVGVMAYTQSNSPEQFVIRDEASKLLNLTSDVFSGDKVVKKLSQKNIENLFAKEINALVKSVSFEKNMSPKEANAEIDELLSETQTHDFDKKVEKLFGDQYKQYHILDQHYLVQNIIPRLRVATKGAIKDILSIQKQKPVDKMMDFVKGGAISKEDREVIIDCFNKLDEKNKEELLSVLEKIDFDIYGNLDEINSFENAIYKKSESVRPHPDRVIKPTEAVARAAVDLLRDALQYKYFKQTGNAEIFFSDKEKQQIKNMSNDEILNKHAQFAWQYHRDAYVIGERIKDFGNDATALGVFVSKFNDRDIYGHVIMKNQDIIKMYFDILKTNFNKFNIQESQELTRFAASLATYSNDPRIKQQIRDTFGIKTYVYDPYQKSQDTYKKEQTKKRLKNAAKRIEQGDNVSGVVIANEIAEIESEYAVKPTPKTTKTIKAKHKLSETQKEILARYKERN